MRLGNMKWKKHSKISAGILLCVPLFLSGCNSIYMSAQDRYQDAGDAAVDAELETLEELTATVYEDAPIVPYRMDKLAPALGITEEELSQYWVIDEHEQEFLDIQEGERYVHLDITYDHSSFLFWGVEGGDVYGDVVNLAENEDQISFAFQADLYPAETLEDFPLEEAAAIGEVVVDQMGLPFVFETAVTLDSSTLNKLREEYSERYGVSVMNAPGPKEKEIRPWTRDDEAYMLYFQMQLDGRAVDMTHYYCYLQLCCRRDGTIVYAKAKKAPVDLSGENGESKPVISSSDAYLIGQNLLKEKQITDGRITSVKLGYFYGYGTEETCVMEPCWMIAYVTEVSGREVTDYLFVNAVTGLEGNSDALY